MPTDIIINSETPVETTVLGVATVTLTHAQILTLPTTGVVVVPAPGVGNIIGVVLCLFQIDTTAGVYTNVLDNEIDLLIDTNLAASNGQGVSGFDELAGIYLQNMLPEQLSNPLPVAALENLPVKIFSQNGSDFTGGNAANTLKVIVYYSVFAI